MNKELIQVRKHDGEKYEFYLYSPEYDGEVGCLGIEIEPYIEVKTPENCFGYPDYIRIVSAQAWNDDGKFIGYKYLATTTHRYLPRWILKKIEKQMFLLMEKLDIPMIAKVN